MELIEIVKPFIYSEDTCDAVIEYFKNGNEPKGDRKSVVRERV